jgi:hypothetical protein
MASIVQLTFGDIDLAYDAIAIIPMERLQKADFQRRPERKDAKPMILGRAARVAESRRSFPEPERVWERIQMVAPNLSPHRDCRDIEGNAVECGRRRHA